MTNDHLAAQALSALTVPTITPLEGRRIAFLGCGDSLAAARPSEDALGHRVISAGDVAWSGNAPAGVEAVVALSWSGKTGATINAAKVAKAAGLEVIAITTNEKSPLAELADTHVVLPQFTIKEEIPAIGYAVHAAASMALCGLEDINLESVASDWNNSSAQVARLVTEAGDIPHGITIASMPDAHGSAEFWMLKIIEATGLTVRTAAIEEIGHVDYFLGPQPHLMILMSGAQEAPRADSLGAALARNGQTVLQVRLADFTSSTGATRQVVGGVIGADVSEKLADKWGRPYFRNHEVDMSAQHIQVPGN
ncbi:SIS domain-containing protein [Jonesiaceae bacterium BS-20]|uniref:SIS domain-containing protein n=1 Tax=Jonesiaceae bacterium BS-20 TaxID=3120821 RepID=A0AAU7DV85_9MICO